MNSGDSALNVVRNLISSPNVGHCSFKSPSWRHRIFFFFSVRIKLTHAEYGLSWCCFCVLVLASKYSCVVGWNPGVVSNCQQQVDISLVLVYKFVRFDSLPPRRLWHQRCSEWAASVCVKKTKRIEGIVKKKINKKRFFVYLMEGSCLVEVIYFIF